jgi:hypothetical protein
MSIGFMLRRAYAEEGIAFPEKSGSQVQPYKEKTREEIKRIEMSQRRD